MWARTPAPSTTWAASPWGGCGAWAARWARRAGAPTPAASTRNLSPAPGRQRPAPARLPHSPLREICLLRHAGLEPRPHLGLRGHPEPRPRRVLRPRWVRDGHVPDAPDRHPRGLCQCHAARLHGVPELEAAALVLAGLRSLRL